MDCKPFINKVKCTCACHNPGAHMMHIVACCHGGYKEEVDKQYYTPSIEDIRVGYECETNVDPYPNWVKTIIKDGDDLNYIKEGDWRVKTHYLTKEQIEAEGWVDNGGDYLMKEGVIDGCKCVLYCEYPYEGKITISYNHGTDHPINLFYGKCPSINEFRTITKLLGI